MTFHKMLFYLLIFKSFIALISAACDADEFECPHPKKCIDSEYICDGDNDCEDASDEEAALCHYAELGVHLVEVTPPADECLGFRCPSNQCIHSNWVCDGEEDCSDGADENSCSLPDHDKTVPETTTTQRTTRRIFTPPGANFYPRSPPTRQFPTTRDYMIFMRPTTTKRFWWTFSTNSDSSGDSSGEHEITDNIQNSPGTTENSQWRNIFSTTVDYQSEKVSGAAENCDPETSILFSSLSWIEISLAVLTCVIIAVVVAFICRRRRLHVLKLNSKRHQEKHTVSYINSPPVPECQVVLVGSAMSIQPAILKPANNDQIMGSPPPYSTTPTTRPQSLNEAQSSTKTER